MNYRMKAAIAGSVAALFSLSACGGSSDASGNSGDGGTELNLVGYSVLEEANKGVISAFQQTDAGKDVTFKESYGASGDQSRAVEAGQDADIVHFSLEPDITRLTDAGIVASDWKSNDTKGICTSSVVALVVRKGNPEHIDSWDDLVKPGIGIITPNPASSGSAKWNLLAAYGSVLAGGGSEDDAAAYMKKFFDNTVALPDSGRDATTAFEGGNGDVLLSYENEAILARQGGADFDYVVPDTTLKIENPCTVTDGAPSAAQDFVDFVKGDEGQKLYGATGYRPLQPIDGLTVQGANDPSNPFPDPSTLQTIDKDFGGWDSANTKYFDENNGILTKIQAEAGK
jgi:sulfate/thiosulfate transport system substrate-binding protein